MKYFLINGFVFVYHKGQLKLRGLNDDKDVIDLAMMPPLVETYLTYSNGNAIIIDDIIRDIANDALATLGIQYEESFFEFLKDALIDAFAICANKTPGN